MLVAAPRLAFPCKNKQLLHFENIWFWEVMEQETNLDLTSAFYVAHISSVTRSVFIKEKNVWNTNCREEINLHFMCDTFFYKFLF
jgi:hypothetical protein